MVRKYYLSRRSSFYLLPILFLLVISACTKPQISFQSVYNGDNATNVVRVDTFAVQLSSVFLDSFITSGSSVQLLGRYIDPYFGTVNSRSFTDIGAPRPLPTLTTSSVYDSIQLILRINKNFYGDTTQVQRFLVSQLTQVMDFPALQNAFYNIDSIPYDPTILGYADVKINPTAGLTSQRKGDSIKISMPYSMGQQLFGLMYRQPDTITNAAIFRGYFKGLTVYPDPNFPGAMYGFKDSIVLRIYYHEPGPVTNQLTADFDIINTTTQFNQISADRTGTPLQLLTQANPELSSRSTGNQAFFQPATAVYTKLLFPTITNLLTYQDYLAVMKATLIIKPVQGTYSPLYSLPPILNLTLTNQGNTLGPILPYGNGSLIIDYLYGTNTSYSYDITTYIQNALTQGAENNAKNGLMLVAPSAASNTSFSRIVMGDAYNAQKSNQISLQIYYASYY
jgi:Domain of unknown function (DUF4270)